MHNDMFYYFVIVLCYTKYDLIGRKRILKYTVSFEVITDKDSMNEIEFPANPVHFLFSNHG